MDWIDKKLSDGLSLGPWPLDDARVGNLEMQGCVRMAFHS